MSIPLIFRYLHRSAGWSAEMMGSNGTAIGL
jgi:hypothetical protein